LSRKANFIKNENGQHYQNLFTQSNLQYHLIYTFKVSSALQEVSLALEEVSSAPQEVSSALQEVSSAPQEVSSALQEVS